MRLLCLPALALVSLSVSAQSTPYSAGAEYQGMIQELHAPAPSPIFLATGQRPMADPGLKLQVRDDHKILRIKTPSMQITIDRQAGTLTLLNLSTQATWVVSAGRAPIETITRLKNEWTLTPAGNPMKLEILNAAMARLSFERPGVGSGLHVAGADPCFGLGERFFQAALSGTHFKVRPADRSGEPGHNWSYVAIPLVYTPSGLGLYADTVFETNFNFNPAGSDFDLKVAQTPVSFYFLTAPNPKAILEQYTSLTGRPENPPLWTFGPWINAVQGKDAVLDLAKRLRIEGIPASALWVFDAMDEPNNLGWPFWFSSYYGDQRVFNDTLHAQGLKVLGYVHPYIRERMLPYPTMSPAWQKGIDEKLLVTSAEGIPHGPAFEPVPTGNIDFTNPGAVDWWQTMLTHAVRDQAWDGWMEDFGEYVDDTDRLAAGDGTRLAEAYPLLYHKITTRIVLALNPNVVSFDRSGFVGTQQFPMLWGGDQSHDWARDTGLPSVITAGITAGMSGFSTWGPDIICDGPDRELFLRWTEFGALTPVMRDHCWARPMDSVNLFHDPGTIALFRKYALLHSALLPAFATYAAEAHRTGVPILRHLVLEYPGDARSATAEYEYLLGPSLLVAPVIEPGATTRKLYLPPGEWISYWTGERFAGGADVTVPAPIDEIPMLIRAGSILPFKPETETAALHWSDPNLLRGSLIWKVYLPAKAGEKARFVLPDGTSAALETAPGTLHLVGTSSVARFYEVVVVMDGAPSAVQLDGKPLAGVVEHTVPTEGWWFDSTAHQLHATFTDAGFTLSISGLGAASGDGVGTSKPQVSPLRPAGSGRDDNSVRVP